MGQKSSDSVKKCESPFLTLKYVESTFFDDLICCFIRVNNFYTYFGFRLSVKMSPAKRKYAFRACSDSDGLDQTVRACSLTYTFDTI